MTDQDSSTNTYLTIGIFGITVIIIIIYAILVVFMYIGQWGIFAPFTPTPPASPDRVFRPLGSPQPLTDQQIKERQELASAIISVIEGTG